MTGQRASSVFKIEKQFAVEDTSAVWQHWGSGLVINWSGENNAVEIYGIGTKFLEAQTAGAFKGSWDITCNMDYANLSMYLLGFESYSYNPATGEHTFKKVDGKRVPTFTQQIKILYRMVSGDSDEQIKLYGCMVTSVTFNQQSNANGLTTVKFSGAYAWEDRNPVMLDSTDFQEFTGDLVEWFCLQVPPGTTIADVDKLSFGVTNGGTMQGTTCSRKATDYFEGKATFSLSATVYANNGVGKFYERFYSGGYATGMTEPKKKNLKPIPAVKITSQYDDTATQFGASIDATDVFAKTNPRGADQGTKMVEAVTFSVKQWTLTIKTNVGDLSGLLP